MKRSSADDWFSKCVRERANWICERCGKDYHERTQGLHCSHNYSRRHRTIRWCGLNAYALCFACHEWYGGNPYESGAWLEEKLSKPLLEVLIEKKESRLKTSKDEEKIIAKHYKAEYEKMRKLRAQGIRGRIEFVSYQ